MQENQWSIVEKKKNRKLNKNKKRGYIIRNKFETVTIKTCNSSYADIVKEMKSAILGTIMAVQSHNSS